MSNSQPDHETPVTLRASTQLSARGELGPAAGTGAASPAQAGHDDDEWLTTPALTVSGLAVLLGTGWLFQRRQRLVERTEHDADADAVPAPLVQEPVIQEPVIQEPVAQEIVAEQPADEGLLVAVQAQEEPAAIQPQQSFLAPLEQRPPRHSHVIGVASQKRLIKGLMWVRTVAGAAAILAAIAIVVFWAIEMTDMRAGDTGLTKPLLVLLLAGWAASWGAGQLANQLHRAFFGRVHPKFDT